ncbi:hypothetical protein ACVXG9_15890 [Escherichia coli]
MAEQHPSKQWQALLQSLAHDRTGHCFFQCLITLVRGIPPLYQAMIRTGELTGKLDDAALNWRVSKKPSVS